LAEGTGEGLPIPDQCDSAARDADLGEIGQVAVEDNVFHRV